MKARLDTQQTELEATKAAVTGTLSTQPAGSSGELSLRGLASAMPAPVSVPVNSTFFALDEAELYYTDGNAWKEVGT